MTAEEVSGGEMAQAKFNGEITRWLHRLGQGDAEAEARVFELLRDELHAMAHRFLPRRGREYTLQASALVSEVYLRVYERPGEQWQDRNHFLSVAAKAMRCVLADHARGRRRIRRLPPGARIELVGDFLAKTDSQPSFDEVDAALDALAVVDPVAAQVVDRRFILGLSMAETSTSLGISLRMAERKWRLARAFLYGRLE